MMEQIILIVHLLVALAIIGLIMLQQGKGADMGASFGAGARKLCLAAWQWQCADQGDAGWLSLFFATSFGLALIANQKSRRVDDLDLISRRGMQDAQRLSTELPVVEEIPAAGSGTGAERPPNSITEELS